MAANSQSGNGHEGDLKGAPDSASSDTEHMHLEDPQRETSAAGNRLRFSTSAETREQGRDDGRKGSHVSLRMGSMAQAGGVNSFENFARSWRRAAGFWEIQPVQPMYRYGGVDDDLGEYQREDVETMAGSQRSLLGEALERRRTAESAVDTDHEDVAEGISRAVHRRLSERRMSAQVDNIFQIQPALASPLAGTIATGTYGSLASRVNEDAMHHAGRLFRQQQEAGSNMPDKEREPLLVRQVSREDGKRVNVVVGQSTLPQTIFNSVNTLVGIGLLSLPLALKYSGWLIGMLFFLFCAVSTSYTAKLLGKCLKANDTLLTFSDLAWASFGNKARTATSILFSLELTAACVALVILFADSLNALIPGWGLTEWKIICGIILIPFGFLPLSILSFSSFVGIVCCLGIVLAVFIDGMIKPHAPGSLRDPAQTYLFPLHWGTLPLGFGLLISPFGGHSVFPNIYRDMRHPRKYTKGVNITYIFTYLLDVAMAVMGLLMFGEGVKDEITSNLFLTKGYPKSISLLVAMCIAIVPLTKVPLNAKPIVSTIEIACGVDARAMASSPSLTGMSGFNRGLLKVAIRILTTVVFVVIAILVPSFDRVMSLLGSVACFAICLILPLSFHLRMFGKTIPKKERMLNWILIVMCTVIAVVSTIFACLPRSLIESF